MSFQKVVKQFLFSVSLPFCFRTVSFQKVVKQIKITIIIPRGFRTVSFQKVVKLNIKTV